MLNLLILLVFKLYLWDNAVIMLAHFLVFLCIFAVLAVLTITYFFNSNLSPLYIGMGVRMLKSQSI